MKEKVMTKKQKEKKLDNLHNWLLSNGWVQDRYSNYKKTVESNEYRVKIQSTSVRYEAKAYHQDNEYSWVRIDGAYLKDISIDENNNLVGLKCH